MWQNITSFFQKDHELSTSIDLFIIKKENAFSLQLVSQVFTCLIHEEIDEPLTQGRVELFFNRAIERMLTEGARHKAMLVDKMFVEISTDLPNMTIERLSVNFYLKKTFSEALTYANTTWFLALSRALPEAEPTKSCIIS